MWLWAYMMSYEHLKTLYYNITLLSVYRIFMLLFDTRESSITITTESTTLGIDLTVLVRVNHLCFAFRLIDDIHQDWNLSTNERPLKRAEEFAFVILTDCTQRHGRRVTG